MLKRTEQRWNVILNNKKSEKLQIVEYIQKNTNPSDYVLFWGECAEIGRYIYLSQRKSPSRFFWEWMLFLENYGSDEMLEEFLSDLKRNKPKIVLDTTYHWMQIPPLNIQDRMMNPKVINKKMNQVMQYILDNYKPIEKIGPWDEKEKWLVYRRID